MEFDTEKLFDMAVQVAGTLLTILVPLLLIYAQKFAAAYVAKLRLNLTDEQNATVDKVVQLAIATAEQLKINGVLPNGDAAKQWVISLVSSELQKYKITLDVGLISDRIESQYNAWLSDGIPDKEFLIGKAIDAGVNAYKGSGVSDEVKKLVAAFSKDYLAEFGVYVNAEVLEQLALSKLNELK